MKTLATAAVVLAVAASAGCGSSSKSSAPPAPTTTNAPTTTASSGSEGQAAGRAGACATPPDAVQRTLAHNLVLVGAQLTNAKMVALPGKSGFYFVSARVSKMGKRDAVATWLVRRLDGGGSVFAIDAAAALISNYGGATVKYPGLTIDAPGVQKSRICAGGPHVDRGVTAPPPGGTGTPG